MTFGEFRKEQSLTIYQDKLTVQFLNIAGGQTIIIVSQSTGITKKYDLMSLHSKIGTNCIGAYEAFEIYQQLTA